MSYTHVLRSVGGKSKPWEHQSVLPLAGFCPTLCLLLFVASLTEMAVSEAAMIDPADAVASQSSVA